MSSGKIVVLRASMETLVEGLEPTSLPAPFEGPEWKGLTGKDGRYFHAASIDGGTLLVPFGGFASAEEVALAVRGLLGAALDHHDEPRGLFIASGDTPPEGGYVAAVTAEGAFEPMPAADDPRLAREAGWAFAAAAAALASPEAKERAEGQAEINPLASAKAAFDAKRAARADQEIMRDTLTAALKHRIEGAPEGEGEDARVIDAAAARFRRAASPAPNPIIEATSALRSAVDGGEIGESEGSAEDKDPPKAD